MDYARDRLNPVISKTKSLRRSDINTGDIARKTGLTRRFVADLFRGRRAPGKRALDLVATALEISQEELRSALLEIRLHR